MNKTTTLLFQIFLGLVAAANAQDFSSMTQFEASSGASRYDVFGDHVSLGDQFAVIGAPGDDDYDDQRYWGTTGNPGASAYIGKGYAYILKKDDTQGWSHFQKIAPLDQRDSANFGLSSAIDGNLLVVSAPLNSFDVQGASRKNFSGAVYIFELENGLWVQKQKIVAPDREANDLFGCSVALKSNQLFVSAHKKGNGKVYLFERNNANVFEFKEALGANTNETNFGFSLYFSGQYLTVSSKIGSRTHYNLYELNNGVITKKSDPTTDIYAGGKQAVSIDGNFLAIGADDEGQLCMPYGMCGEVRIFEKDAQGNWQPYQVLSPPSGFASSNLGTAVALEGDLLVASAYKEILVYKKTNGSFTYDHSITAGYSNTFGRQFALNKGTLIVGEPSYTVGSPSTGAYRGRALLYESTAVTAAENPENLAALKVFPNPTARELFVEAGKGSLQFYDLEGRLVKQVEINASGMMVDLSDLSEGLYSIIWISAQQNERLQAKLLKY